MNSAKVHILVVDTPTPSDKLFAKLTVTMTDFAGEVTTVDLDNTEVPTPTADGTGSEFVVPFDDLAAGACTVTAQAFDTDGNELGNAATGTGTIADQTPATGHFPQPTTITVQ